MPVIRRLLIGSKAKQERTESRLMRRGTLRAGGQLASTVIWVAIMLSLVRLGFSLFRCLPVSYLFCMPLAYLILMWFASAVISTRGLYFLSVK